MIYPNAFCSVRNLNNLLLLLGCIRWFIMLISYLDLILRFILPYLYGEHLKQLLNCPDDTFLISPAGVLFCSSLLVLHFQLLCFAFQVFNSPAQCTFSIGSKVIVNHWAGNQVCLGQEGICCWNEISNPLCNASDFFVFTLFFFGWLVIMMFLCWILFVG